jgi:hypothetical protein
MAMDAYFFMHLLAICISENHLFSLFTYLIGLFVLLLFNFLSSLYILNINLLSIGGCLLILVIVPFEVQKLFSLMQSHLSILPPISWAIESYSEYLCLYLSLFLLYFPVVVSRSHIKMFILFGVDFYTR